MTWQTLSLHFKQQYDGAFRYLDRCGEFMLAAVERMNFLPGETKPTGAKLEIPERGLSAGVDTVQLVAVQEMPGDDQEFFLQTCLGLAGLANEHFTPKRVITNGFACKSYWSIPNAEALLAQSLNFGGDSHVQLGKHLGMVPAHKRLDVNFLIGQHGPACPAAPGHFRKGICEHRHNPNFKASSSQEQRVERLNKFADRFAVQLNHALLLELDLVEVDPPPRSLEEHFNVLMRYTETLRKHFTLQ